MSVPWCSVPVPILMELDTYLVSALLLHMHLILVLRAVHPSYPLSSHDISDQFISSILHLGPASSIHLSFYLLVPSTWYHFPPLPAFDA